MNAKHLAAAIAAMQTAEFCYLNPQPMQWDVCWALKLARMDLEQVLSRIEVPVDEPRPVAQVEA